MSNSIKGLRYIKAFEKCVSNGRKLFVKKLFNAYSKYYYYIKHDSIYVDRFLNAVALATEKNYL
jgi:thiaminase